MEGDLQRTIEEKQVSHESQTKSGESINLHPKEKLALSGYVSYPHDLVR